MLNIKYEVGDNIGGLAKLNFVDVEDIIRIPDPVGNVILEDIELQPGRTWFEAYFTLESLGYSEPMRLTKHGEEFQMELKGFLPKNHPNLAETLAYLKRRKLVFVAYDNNDMRLLIGSKENYLRFERTLDTQSQSSGRNGFAVTFSGKSFHEAYFYAGGLEVSENQIAVRNSYLLLETGGKFIID